MTFHARALLISCTLTTALLMTPVEPAVGQAENPAVARSYAKTQKPPLHGQHWMAITGKPLGATAGAMMFQRGGNAVDAACAMIAATSTMWDVLHWGGETQALIYDPRTKKVVAINGLGIAPTGATPEFYRKQGFEFPPAYGPLAAVTPGTPGAILLMLSEYGTLSLAEVLGPSIELADGYPIEAETADRIERWRDKLKEWPYSKQVMLPHLGEAREAPHPGEIFRQPDLAATLRKLVEAEAKALEAGKSRKEAIQAAYDRFYRGDIAEEFVRSVKEQGGLITLADLDKWRRSSRSRSPRTTAASTCTSSTPGRRARRCCSRSTCSRTSTSSRWATTARTTSTPCTRR
jgi:gamma-glutamyltranspeptidase / glutathione hydrolase